MKLFTFLWGFLLLATLINGITCLATDKYVFAALNLPLIGWCLYRFIGEIREMRVPQNK